MHVFAIRLKLQFIELIAGLADDALNSYAVLIHLLDLYNGFFVV